MRLVPLLEIVMTGGSIPLKLTEPVVTVTVRSEISATVKLEQGATTPHRFRRPRRQPPAIQEQGLPLPGSPAQHSWRQRRLPDAKTRFSMETAMVVT
jgi:hypothetical protein